MYITNSTNKVGTKICRDFVRGVCNRKQCRYPHVLSEKLVIFCHDFQNRGNCIRGNCKFLHYTIEEEEYYRTNGEFPSSAISNDEEMFPCKDHIIYGRCGHKDCYTHPSQIASKKHQHQQEPRKLPSNERHQRLSQGLWKRSAGVDGGDYPDSPFFISDHDSVDFQSLKRSAAKAESLDSSPPPPKRYRDEFDRIDVLAIIRRFEEEQVMLRRRVEANEIKIAELRASNEYLHAQLRLTNVQCSAVVNPVTVTQTSSQPQTVVVVSIAPVQMQAAPIVSIATPQTQIIASQQNITSNQQLAPAHAQQILGTSQITLTPYPIMTHSILPH